ncbi:hypothetical protein SLEP1_g35198 [Rubroshorea leprosula]|uniref:Uncharacterized protein n=1 Tax=Rubroshorea leprosula TaxID=152421 RepID=A0AAV5KMY1_9ROSI|nr:hypothetical protein SLEP1_g35198 [Rubroshorea leprosula]
MKINYRNLAALFALILMQTLITSSNSLCFYREDVPLLPPRERNFPRRLLGSMASFSTSGNTVTGAAAAKEPKKAVEPSLRKAPASVPNPTQNK